MNIIFYHSKSIDPYGGGIMRVTQVLHDFFANEHNVYYLIAKKTINDDDPTHYYLPDTNNALSAENREFVNKLIYEQNIDVFINQDGISPISGYIITLIQKNDRLKIYTVIHNSLYGLYGAFPKIPLPTSVKCHIPSWLVSTADKIAFRYFRAKYGKYWDGMMERSDAVVTLSPSLNKGLTEFLGYQIPKQKLFSIPNPVTIRVDGSLIHRKKQVLYVGRLSYEKNLSTLLKIWSGVEPYCQEWQLVLVGDGPDRKHLEKVVRELRLERVVFAGIQSPEKYYAEASIFCMTSFFEGLPLVLLEAMAYGCVPMVFDCFETACDIIDDGINGKMIRPFNISTYINELILLMDNQEQRHKMAIAAIEKSRQFDIDKIATKWYGLLK